MIGRRLFEILGRNHAEIQLIWLEIIFSESENGKYGFTTLGPDTVLPERAPRLHRVFRAAPEEWFVIAQ